MQESTRLEDDWFELEHLEGSSRQGEVYLHQDAPEMAGVETLRLSPRAQYDLLEWLYKRRYPLYMATHLTLGGLDTPAWIASGKPGNVARIVDATDEQDQDEAYSEYPPDPAFEQSGDYNEFSQQPLDQAELRPDDYQAQEGDYYLVSVYAGRYVVMRYNGLDHSWKQEREIKTSEAHNLVVGDVPLGKKGGFLFYHSAQPEKEYQYPEQQSNSHVLHEHGEQ